MKDYTSIDKVFPGINKEYKLTKLDEHNASKDPFHQFARWFEEAVKAGVPHANAMVVSTVSKKGAPSSRVVLLKGFNEHGFLFYTHYTSPKAHDLKDNPHAAIVFFWPQVERQIRITGKVKRTSQQESAEYFANRSMDAKLATWISQQSQSIKDRKALEAKLDAIRKKFEGRDIPSPEFWGGYRVVPDSFEFWQGREHRLNDRLRYRKTARGWKIERLQP